MINTAKYFALLENLKFNKALANKANNANNFETPDALASNLLILQKYANLEVDQQLQELCVEYQLTAEQKSTIDPGIEPTISYIVRLQHVLYSITKNINFHSDAKEDLISVAHLKLCIQATQELSYYSLRCQLHEDFYKSPIFHEAQGKVKANPSLLLLSIQFFVNLLPIRQFHIANSMELVQRDLLAAIMSLRVQEDSEHLDKAISYLWQQESKSDFFRHILLLKATPLCTPLAKLLHHQLLRKLNSPQGFGSFVDALQQTPNVSPTRNAEIVANIVARKGFSQLAQQKMILQVLEYCKFYLQDADKMCAGILTLRRLYDLNETNQKQIEEILSNDWKTLTNPEDVISGLILMDHQELCNCILFWQQLFCSSSVACLPSNLLIPYLPLLLQLYDSLPLELPATSQLSGIISRCLDNRDREKELPEILKRLFAWEIEEEPPWKCLHPRILILPSANSNQVEVKVAHKDHQADHDMGRILPGLLVSSSHHSLTCNVFLALLGFMGSQLRETKPLSRVDFISSETELKDFLHSKYQLKLDLLIALNQMVAHQPLRAQLALHTKEFLLILKDLLLNRSEEQETTDQILLLVLNLLQELLEGSEDIRLSESSTELKEQLQQLAGQSSNPLIQQSVQSLLTLIKGAWRPSEAVKIQPFQKARSLIEEKQSHLQVYGIQMIMDLLKKRDPATMAQGHLIIALALTTLKDKESYTFLNCVRLFVSLVHVMESEVLDKLSDEYLSDTAELDYRLVVGEAILKVAQELGPLCYRYKAVLLNCFMHGSRSHVPEFRMSAFANLAQLCRLLAYQVQNFFQELLQLVNNELSTGGYVPAKRAAVLVLAELLNGMDNLLDYQEMLLPIYRLLRAIEAEESCDPQMRQHAANGLKILNEKCRQMIQSSLEENSLHKRIKVLGIKDEVSPQRKNRHILELN
ncbi:transport and Golgi organization protein 6 [Drosophila elegans]|uniref:transport and Golgi organization protein 6 n=1 Tax=Drosophila elegans TaxID=30023 RepID=UPI0007E76FA1|nr:transport and Golgi organization protein 6 [Drosophila elegans]